MKKILLLFFLLISVGSKGMAQVTNITGQVNDEKGAAIHGATIKILNTNFATTTNKEGHYSLKGSLPSTIEIKVSAISYKSQQKQVNITLGTENRFDFTLQEDLNELQTVEVTGRKQSSYKNDNSFSATKVDMKMVDIPQSISTVTKELMQDRQAVKLNDIIQNVAGVTQFSNYDDVTMRVSVTRAATVA
ncbi:carboxypeptidase-like regulatory domain-containing protein [Mucilaginibacter sp. CAU 1740]|uniref:carboxypeptidase-like regulatory domain-containing protein n=1 Tax=Mucilaginibacter sp. CAU 1740 TaxID=3140365 RepID=UPI00325A98E5